MAQGHGEPLEQKKEKNKLGGNTSTNLRERQPAAVQQRFDNVMDDKSLVLGLVAGHTWALVNPLQLSQGDKGAASAKGDSANSKKTAHPMATGPYQHMGTR
jgi:hypothetical protein